MGGEPDMKLPEGFTCADCYLLKRCVSFGIPSAIEHGTECDWSPSKFHFNIEIARQLRSRITELKRAQEWIPVSERLPEVKENTPVLVRIEGCDGCDLVYFSKGVFKTFSGTTVTHWLPVPPAPKEGDMRPLFDMKLESEEENDRINKLNGD